MKRSIYMFLSVYFCLLGLIVAQGNNTLLGTWCVGEDGLVLTFEGEDTLKVASLSDESVSGTGIYIKNDSAFTATVANGDVEMKMRYRYQWAGDDTVKAKAEFFTINGDSVSFSRRMDVNDQVQFCRNTACQIKFMENNKNGKF